jgi:hypothetical protein
MRDVDDDDDDDGGVVVVDGLGPSVSSVPVDGGEETG